MSLGALQNNLFKHWDNITHSFSSAPKWCSAACIRSSRSLVCLESYSDWPVSFAQLYTTQQSTAQSISLPLHFYLRHNQKFGSLLGILSSTMLRKCFSKNTFNLLFFVSSRFDNSLAARSTRCFHFVFTSSCSHSMGDKAVCRIMRTHIIASCDNH